jgi:hypothetical protein
MNAKLSITTALGAVALLTIAATVHGQTRGIFQRISTGFLSDGYTRVSAPVSGWLDDDESETFTVWLTSGERYAVAAACDRDCSDVDLRLFSPTGTEVGRDLASDDEPVIYTTARRSGRYEVRVSMASCSEEPCEYFAGVFKQ